MPKGIERVSINGGESAGGDRIPAELGAKCLAADLRSHIENARSALAIARVFRESGDVERFARWIERAADRLRTAGVVRRSLAATLGLTGRVHEGDCNFRIGMPCSCGAVRRS
ncbi:MAG TPA: hypothetical protein VFV60_01740 [bacterium]|nr:hypothetical protein [bacterium]